MRRSRAGTLGPGAVTQPLLMAPMSGAMQGVENIGDSRGHETDDDPDAAADSAEQGAALLDAGSQDPQSDDNANQGASTSTARASAPRAPAVATASR